MSTIENSKNGLAHDEPVLLVRLHVCTVIHFSCDALMHGGVDATLHSARQIFYKIADVDLPEVIVLQAVVAIVPGWLSQNASKLCLPWVAEESASDIL